MSSSSVAADEVAKFTAMASEWWDPRGKFAPLHAMNPVRLDYIQTQVAAEFGCDRTAPAPFAGLKLLDIGCGGGLVCEPMARLGAQVTGRDASVESIEVAKAHAAQMGLTIDYAAETAEDLAATGAQFDVVLALEIIEHVADPGAFVATCARLVRPGGLLFVSTLNRTPRSYFVAILGAERVMRWLPVGTHDWSRFLTPAEVEGFKRAADLDPLDAMGMVFNPVTWDWRLSAEDLSVNFISLARQPAGQVQDAPPSPGR